VENSQFLIVVSFAWSKLSAANVADKALPIHLLDDFTTSKEQM
jgi:hypothetical protein